MELSAFKKVILISSGQPSLNPRLVKEADTLCDAGYEVIVIYAYWNDWGDDLNKNLLLTKKWKAVCAGGHPTEKPLVYFISRLMHKLAKWLFIKLHGHFLAGPAMARSTWFLLHEAKKHLAVIYIGHNLGALPATVKAAQKHHAKCGFDMEDLHRYEVSDDTGSFNYKAVKYLEDKYLKQLDYLTASSPQIAGAYEQLYPDKKPLTLLNVFPISAIQKKRGVNNAPIKLFWFSQTVGPNRGIEDAVKALSSLKSDLFELHLLGHITAKNKKDLVQMGLNNIYFHAPVAPDDIVDFASQFDIGLALEPGFCTNNKLALSNKLFTYLQAGLAIIASDTLAQRSFIEENPGVGKIYPIGDVQSFASILSDWQSNPEILFDTCQAALKLGHEKLNWENESVKFMALVNETLSKVE